MWNREHIVAIHLRPSTVWDHRLAIDRFRFRGRDGTLLLFHQPTRNGVVKGSPHQVQLVEKALLFVSGLDFAHRVPLPKVFGLSADSTLLDVDQLFR